jgi:hypothetical protein
MAGNTNTIKLAIEVDDNGSIKVKQLGEETKKTFKEMEDGPKKAQGPLNSLREGWVMLAAKVAIVTAAIYAAKRAIYDTAKEMASFGSDIVRTSGTMGMTISQFQQWRYVAKMSDVELQSMTMGFRMLSQNILDVSRGTGEAKDAFVRLGISVKDSNGQLKSINDMIPELADKLSKIQNPTERLALTMEIFGSRSGEAFDALLRQGGPAIETLIKEFRDLGLEIDESLLKRLAESEQAFKRLSFSGEKLKASLGPAVEFIAGRVEYWHKMLIEIFNMIDTRAQQADVERLKFLKEQEKHALALAGEEKPWYMPQNIYEANRKRMLDAVAEYRKEINEIQEKWRKSAQKPEPIKPKGISLSFILPEEEQYKIYKAAEEAGQEAADWNKKLRQWNLERAQKQTSDLINLSEATAFAANASAKNQTEIMKQEEAKRLEDSERYIGNLAAMINYSANYQTEILRKEDEKRLESTERYYANIAFMAAYSAEHQTEIMKQEEEKRLEDSERYIGNLAAMINYSADYQTEILRKEEEKRSENTERYYANIAFMAVYSAEHQREILEKETQTLQEEREKQYEITAYFARYAGDYQTKILEDQMEAQQEYYDEVAYLANYAAEHQTKVLEAATKKQTDMTAIFERASYNTTRIWSDHLQQMLTHTESFSEGVKNIFAGMGNYVISVITEMVANYALFGSIGGLSGARESGSLGGIFGLLGFGRILGLQEGGAFWVNRPTPLLVGEGGRKEFVSVTPEGKMGGGNIYIYHTNNVDARGAQQGVSKEILRALRETENRAVRRSVNTVADNRLRGGKFTKIFE